MDELKEIKLKNYQYLNEVAIKGETLFTGSSLMELFPICEIARSRGVDDIIYNRDQGAFVLEVNTAPGLEGETVERYVEAFQEYV